MDGARLHTLGSTDLSNLHDDCGLSDNGSRRKLGRQQMVADILSWQERWRTDAGIAKSKSAATESSKGLNVRLQATPMRQRRGACGKCGWTPKGSPRHMALCACTFLRMDPFRPVSAVLGLAHLQNTGGSDATSAKLIMSIQCADHTADIDIELRMAWVSAPSCHVWPHSMTVQINDTEVAHVEPPKDGNTRRADAPIRLKLSKDRIENKLEVQAHVKPPHKANELVLCVVQPAATVAVSDLLHVCVKQPEITTVECARLWDSLHADTDSAVECSTPWLQSLVCPLTRERIWAPVRGITCKHLQCFDLEAYLETSSRAAFHRRWHCPVCDKLLYPAELAVCGLTRLLLKHTASSVAAVPLQIAFNAINNVKAAEKKQQSTPPAPSRQCQQGTSHKTATEALEQTTTQRVRKRSASSEAGERQRRCWKEGVLTATRSHQEGESRGVVSWGGRLQKQAELQQGAFDL